MKRPRWQFTLRTILLLTAAVGVWTAVIVNRREIPQLEQRIKAMRLLARELDIKDPNKIAVVKCQELWYDDNEWKIYLPEGKFQVSLATQEVDAQDLAPPSKSAPLPAGTFRLSIAQEKQGKDWRIRVLKNGQEFITVDEPATWHPGHGSSGGGAYSTTEQMNSSEPLVLFRRRFMQPVSATSSQTPNGPCAGVLLWIEPVK
ncbi:hypothetical protein [Anatilimnocola floriformis]|uniref:hypothetical protein n=1 Tax=Anatilimnocola floriformis TaxID=2948575 RepID=UPI0020C45042|nr:hypothetical protein [Anatilimnocola floriformis]